MNGKYAILQQLLPLLEEFEEKSNKQPLDLHTFIAWVEGELFSTETERDSIHTDFGKTKNYSIEQSAEIHISTLIATMYKYAKHYSKKVLEETPFRTLDDFTFTATLMGHGTMSKSELINHNLMEITSGTEVIKRLAKLDLIEEFPDPNDGRSKQVKITQTGVVTILDAFNKMNKVSHVISGDLSPREKNMLLSTLLKLKAFHNTVHQEDKRSSVDEIVDKYLLEPST